MHEVVEMANLSPPSRTPWHVGGRTRKVRQPHRGKSGCRRADQRLGRLPQGSLCRKGERQSGAFRIITFFASENIPVFLLTVYAKDGLKTLTDAQVNAMKLAVKAIAAEYERKKGHERYGGPQIANS
jgi:hypothetical protein